MVHVSDMTRIQLVSPLYDVIDGWYHDATRHHLVDVAPPMPMIEKVIDILLQAELTTPEGNKDEQTTNI